MRKPRDAEDTVERVLEAAQTLFAEKGFAGTSLAMISEKCGISDGLIIGSGKGSRQQSGRDDDTNGIRLIQFLEER
jgi:hypothetical protein